MSNTKKGNGNPPITVILAEEMTNLVAQAACSGCSCAVFSKQGEVVDCSVGELGSKSCPGPANYHPAV